MDMHVTDVIVAGRDEADPSLSPTAANNTNMSLLQPSRMWPGDHFAVVAAVDIQLSKVPTYLPTYLPNTHTIQPTALHHPPLTTHHQPPTTHHPTPSTHDPHHHITTAPSLYPPSMWLSSGRAQLQRFSTPCSWR